MNPLGSTPISDSCSNSCSPLGGSALSAVSAGPARLVETAHAPGEQVPRHSHSRPQLCVVLDGTYTEWYQGTAVRCGAGDVILYAVGETHANRFHDDGARCLVTSYDPGLLDLSEDEIHGRQGITVSRSGVPSVLALDLVRELGRSDSSTMAIEERAIGLLYHFLEAPSFETCGAPPRWLERVRELAFETLAARPTLSSLSQDIGVSRAYLSRQFRHHYGCTVGDYMRQIRVTEAYRRLTRTDSPLSQIAFDLGFSDQAHFTRTLTGIIGLTPAQVRAYPRN